MSQIPQCQQSVSSNNNNKEDQATQSHSFFSLNQIGKASANSNDVVFGDSSNNINNAGGGSSFRPFLSRRTSLEQQNQFNQIQVQLVQSSDQHIQVPVQKDALEGMSDKRNIFSKQNFVIFEETKYNLHEDIPQLEFEEEFENENNNNNNSCYQKNEEQIDEKSNISEEKKSNLNNSQINSNNNELSNQFLLQQQIQANLQQSQELLSFQGMQSSITQQQQMQEKRQQVTIGQGSGSHNSQVIVNNQINLTSISHKQQNANTAIIQEFQLDNNNLPQSSNALQQQQQQQQQGQQQQLTQKSRFSMKQSNQQQNSQLIQNNNNSDKQANPAVYSNPLSPNKLSICRNQHQIWREKVFYIIFYILHCATRLKKKVLLFQKPHSFLSGKAKQVQLSILRDKSAKEYYSEGEQFFEAIKSQQQQQGKINNNNGMSSLREEVLQQLKLKQRWGIWYKRYLIWRKRFRQTLRNIRSFSCCKSHKKSIISKEQKSPFQGKLMTDINQIGSYGKNTKNNNSNNKIQKSAPNSQIKINNKITIKNKNLNTNNNNSSHIIKNSDNLIQHCAKQAWKQLTNIFQHCSRIYYEKQIPVFDPDSPILQWWKAFVSILTILTLFYLPLLIAFGQPTTDKTYQKISQSTNPDIWGTCFFSYFLITVFAVDLIVKCNSSYSYSHGSNIRIQVQPQILLHSLKQHSFQGQTLTLIALVLFFFVFFDYADMNFNYTVLLTVFVVVTQILFNSGLQDCGMELKTLGKKLGGQFERAARVALVLAMYLHYVACIWLWLGSFQLKKYYLSNAKSSSLSQNTTAEQLQQQYNHQPGWIFSDLAVLTQKSQGELYIHSFFTALQLFLNNSFSLQQQQSSSSSSTDAEKIFFCVVGVCSLLVYSFLLYNLARFIKARLHRSLQIEKERSGLQAYFDGLQIDPELRDRALHYQESNRREQAQITLQTLESRRQLQCLSKTLRKEIEADIRIKAINRVSVLTQYFSPSFLSKLAECAEEVIYAPEELIVKANQAEVPTFYIVLVGQVELFIEMTAHQQQQQHQLQGFFQNNNNVDMDQSINSMSAPSLFLNSKNILNNNNNNISPIMLNNNNKASPTNQKAANNSNYNNNNSNFLLNKSKGASSSKKHQHATLEILGPYSYFGDAEFFQQSQVWGKSAKSVGVSKVLQVSLPDFLELLPKFPLDREAFCYLRDSLVCNNDFGAIGRQCPCCSQSSHTVLECPLLFYQGVKQKLKPYFARRELQIEKRRRRFNRKGAQGNNNDNEQLLQLNQQQQQPDLQHKSQQLQQQLQQIQEQQQRKKIDRFNAILQKSALLKITEQYYLNNTELLEGYLKQIQYRRMQIMQALCISNGSLGQLQQRQVQYLQLAKFNKMGQEEQSDCIESISESYISSRDTQQLQQQQQSQDQQGRQRVTSLQEKVQQQQQEGQNLNLHPLGSSGSSIQSQNNLSSNGGGTSPNLNLQQQQSFPQPGGALIKQTTFFQQQLPDINEEHERVSSNQSSLKSILSGKKSDSSKPNSSSLLNNSKSQPQIQIAVSDQVENNANGNGSGPQIAIPNTTLSNNNNGNIAKNISNNSSSSSQNVFYNRSISLPDKSEDGSESLQQQQLQNQQQPIQQQSNPQATVPQWMQDDKCLVFGGEPPLSFSQARKTDTKKKSCPPQISQIFSQQQQQQSSQQNQQQQLQQQQQQQQQQQAVSNNFSSVFSSNNNINGQINNRPWQSQNLIAEDPLLDTNRILDGLDLNSQSQISQSQKMGQQSQLSKRTSSKFNSMKSWNTQDWQKMLSKFSNLTSPIAPVDDLNDIEPEEEKGPFTNKNVAMQSFSLYFPKNNVENVLARFNKKVHKKQKQLSSFYKKGSRHSPSKNHSINDQKQ